MNKHIMIGIIWIGVGVIIMAICGMIGNYYLQKGRTEQGKKSTDGIIENNNTNTNKVLNAVSEVKTDIELLKVNQEAIQTYIKNSLNPGLPNTLSEKGYSIGQLEKLANQAIENSKDFFDLGNAYFIKTDYVKAIKYFEKSLNNAPAKIPTNNYFNLGQAKLKFLEKNFGLEFISGSTLSNENQIVLKEIINHFSMAIDENDNNFQAYNNRGIVYLKLNEIDKAEFDFEKSKYINSLYPPPYLNLSNVYIHKKKSNYVNLALNLLNKAIELDSTFAQAYFNRGNMYELYFNEFEKAVDDYKQAIKHGLTSKHVYLNLGITYSRWGKFNLANENFNIALKIDPNFDNAKQSLLNVINLQKRKK